MNGHSANASYDNEFNKDEDGNKYNGSNTNLDDVYGDGKGGERKCRDASTPEILGEIREGTSPEVSPVRVRCNQYTSHTVQQQQIHFFTLASGLTVGLCEYCAQMHPPSEANITSLDEIYYNSCTRYNNNNNNNESDTNENEGKDYAHQKLFNNDYLEYLKNEEQYNINNNNSNTYITGAGSHSSVYFVCQCTICVKANNSDYYPAVANGTYTQEQTRSRSPCMHLNNISNNNNNDDSNNNVNCVNGNTDNTEEMKFVNDAVCTIFDGDRLSQFLRRILQDHYTQPYIVNAVGRLLLHIPMMQAEVWKMLFEVLASAERLDGYNVALLAIASRRYLPVVDELCKQLNQSSTLAHYLHEPYILLTPTKRLCTEEMVCGGNSSNQLSSVGLSPSPLTTSTYRSSVVSEVQFSGIGYSHNHPVVNLFASSDGMLMRESE